MAAQSAQPFRWHYPDLDDKNFELHGRSLFVLLIVFVLLLFFVLLCLYVRWACCFLGRWGPSTVPGGTGIPRPGRTNRGSHGLDPKVISSLPVLLYRQVSATAAATAAADGEDSMCSICLSIFTEGEKVKILPKCGHTFHPECVDKWLETQSSCPLCRSCIDQLPTIEVSDEIV